MLGEEGRGNCSTPSGIRRAVAKRRAITRSATVSVSTPGVLPTMIPLRVQAGMSRREGEGNEGEENAGEGREEVRI